MGHVVPGLSGRQESGTVGHKHSGINQLLYIIKSNKSGPKKHICNCTDKYNVPKY